MKKYWILAIIAYMSTACQESLEDRCARESKEYTKKNCPVKIDNNTTLDSLTFERETHTLHYYYKLTDNRLGFGKKLVWNKQDNN